MASHELLRVRVRPEVRAKVEQTAVTLGISTAAYLDVLLAHVHDELGPDGRPTWWTEPVPTDQGTLPVST